MAPRKPKVETAEKPVLVKPDDSDYLAIAREIAERVGGETGEDAWRRQMSQPVYSTGCLGVDLMTGRIDPTFGNGGFSSGSYCEFLGPPGVFKTGSLASLGAQVQKRDLFVVILFTEEPNYEYLYSIGLKRNQLIPIDVHRKLKGASQDERTRLAENTLPSLAEQTMDPRVGMVAIDSVKAIISANQVYQKGDQRTKKPRGYNESEPVAIRAKLMEKFYNDVKVHNQDSIVVMVNQYTAPIDTNTRSGNPYERKVPTPGGSRMEFESVYRLGVDSYAEKVKTPVENKLFGGTGNYPAQWLNINYKMHKNRYGSPDRKVKARFFLDGRYQFDNTHQLLYACTLLGIIERKGNFYSLDGKKENGEENAVEYLDSRPELIAEYTQQLMPRGNELFSLAPGGEKTPTREKLDQPFSTEYDEEE